MGGLIKSEFRKVFTTNLWWALLIPVAVISFGSGWMGTGFGTINSIEQEIGRPLPLGLLTMSMSTNFSVIFAGLLGALAITGEHRSKSITTTYLTASSRGAVLSAKLISYTGLGLLYGLVNVLAATAGGLVGAGTNGLGNLADWFAVGGAGLLAMVLWTLLGVGFGAVVSSPVVAIMVLLIYKFVFEFIVTSFLMTSDPQGVSAYLPGTAGSGIVGNLAVPIFIRAAAGSNEQMVPQDVFDVLHFFFGGSYHHPWWLSLLTFAGYTTVFVLGGWYFSRRRDIT
ncbi:ABC transporter permease subunit [Saccharopolyspora sp. HNM0986]|uniref:ABC transporter permease n=1 Tax=Saccharopolyspora galaxeae TaxID=2781241 RepID=UPI00190B0B0E|nr:ABC transporter permease [Saccharopolyspora sp. HNM0986]MBK0870483.1 ABC transporter permease subunit [Saccharopolyspora sp. HNM0986]